MQNLKDTVNAILDTKLDDKKETLKEPLFSFLQYTPALIMMVINAFTKDKYAKVGLVFTVAHSLYKIYDKDEVAKVTKIVYENEKGTPVTEEVVECAKKSDLQHLIKALLIMAPVAFTCLACVPSCGNLLSEDVDLVGNKDGYYKIEKV
jgi:hypothetical protein